MKSKTQKNPIENEQFSRVLIGFFVFAFAFFALYLGGWFLTLVLLFVFWHVNTEFIKIVRAKGINPSNKWIRFVSMLFFIVASFPVFGMPRDLPIRLFIFVFIFGVIGCFFRLIFRGSKNEHIATIPDIGASVLGFVYTGLLPSFVILLRELGFIYVFIAITSTAMCDVGAYYGGRLFGKTALKPQISPKKTLEGAVLGFLASVIVSVVMVYVEIGSFNYNLAHGVIIGLFAGIFSQFGDFFESLLKRDAGIKDSGKALLSHGGLLDRLDSYIFVIWAIYFYISWVVLREFSFVSF